MKIITDHKWKPFKYGNEVPGDVIEDYDHLEDCDKFDGFVCYHKRWFHTSDFLRLDGVTHKDNPYYGYHGYHGDSFFLGVLIRLSDDCEMYQIATYVS